MNRIIVAFCGALAASSALLCADPAAPTFNKDIAPIVFENCASCHRPGEVAPFPLLTCADVKKKGETIVLSTEEGTTLYKVSGKMRADTTGVLMVKQFSLLQKAALIVAASQTTG